MTPSTNADENGGAPRNAQPASASADRVPNAPASRGEVQFAPVAPSAARGRSNAVWAALSTAVAVAAMVWVAYQANARNEVAQIQREIAAQHAESVSELQSLKDKIQGITVAQNRTDAEIAKLVKQSPPAKSEIQGLQNHVNTLRREPKAQKR
jgi:septal ring factor EnvC (AmiA/AmiB activator)